MKSLKVFFPVILFVVLVSNTVSAQNITSGSGGSIKTELDYGIIINKESSITREWITVHDSSLPADITGTVGVKTIYEKGDRYSNGNYQYSAAYTITTKESIAAIEVRFLTFDIWGNHSRNLSAIDIVDMSSGTTRSFDNKWSIYSENEVSEYYASIAYISQIRTMDGKVIKADTKAVLEQARKFAKKFTEGDLEPTPEKK